LVTSELIYMDEDPEHVDLFDMRYVEGELLYYTRDESVFIRSRRVVTFVFDADLVRARFKDQGMRWQRLVAAMGLLSAAVKQLSAWLSEEGLFFRVAFVRTEGDSPLEAERGLCQLLLREWIEKEMAEVVEIDRTEVAVEKAEEDARTAQADVVVFTMQTRPFEDLDKRVRAAFVNLGEPSPALWWSDRTPGNITTDAEPWSAWIAVSVELLQSIIDGR
jgi:hypothetical protein